MIKEKINYSSRSLVIILISLFPIIDSLNGLLLNLNYSSKLGIIWRTILFFLLIGILFNNFNLKKTYQKIVLIFLFFSIIISYFLMILFPDNLELNPSISIGVKLITVILLLDGLLTLNALDLLNLKSITKIINLNAILILLLYFIPFFLGYGFSVYSDGSGFKGFYYSNNELNAVLLMFFMYSIYMLNRYRSLIYGILSGGFLLGCLLISSKSSVILCLIIIIYFLIKASLSIIKSISKKKFILMICFLIFSLILFFVLFYSKIEMFVHRQLYLLNISDNFIEYFTSSRSTFALNNFENLYDSNNFILRLFFGNSGASKPCEMDVLDLFLYFGLFGFFDVVIFFVNKIKVLCYNKELIFLLTLILLYSFLTGHVLFYGISGCYFAVFLSTMIIYVEFLKNKKMEGDVSEKSNASFWN